jgi:hypothetical protein
MQALIPRRIVPSAEPSPLSPRQVEREFLGRLANGAELRPAGRARRDPPGLLAAGYLPRHKVELFDTTYYLTRIRQNEDIRFFVAYVAGRPSPAAGSAIHPRIFYKDLSLVWRSASHYARSRRENWIGKGDIRVYLAHGDEYVASAEATTDLPLEVQTAFETLSRSARRVLRDDAAVGLVLRRGPDDRIAAYRDFTQPRRRAQADPRNLVNRGRRIARFTRRNDPTSLRFAAGFEPDFARGILEVSSSTSRLYGGELRRFRILSSNRKVRISSWPGRATSGSSLPRRRRPRSRATAFARSTSRRTRSSSSRATSTTAGTATGRRVGRGARSRRGSRER